LLSSKCLLLVANSQIGGSDGNCVQPVENIHKTLFQVREIFDLKEKLATAVYFIRRGWSELFLATFFSLLFQLSSLEVVAAICLHRPSSSGLVSEYSSYNLDQTRGACIRLPSFLRSPLLVETYHSYTLLILQAIFFLGSEA